MSVPPPPEFRFGPVTRTDLVRYAGASGDFNPLHHDEGFAREAGLPMVMAHGMLSAGPPASFLPPWFGAGRRRRHQGRVPCRVAPRAGPAGRGSRGAVGAA